MESKASAVRGESTSCLSTSNNSARLVSRLRASRGKSNVPLLMCVKEVAPDRCFLLMSIENHRSPKKRGTTTGRSVDKNIFKVEKGESGVDSRPVRARKDRSKFVRLSRSAKIEADPSKEDPDRKTTRRDFERELGLRVTAT